MSEYISLHEINRKSDLMEFELLECLLIKAKVQPYSPTGALILCPSKYNQNYIEKSKEHQTAIKKMAVLNLILSSIPVWSIEGVECFLKKRIVPSSESLTLYKMYFVIQTLIPELQKIGYFENFPILYGRDIIKFRSPFPPEDKIKDQDERDVYQISITQIKAIESIYKYASVKKLRVDEQIDSIKSELIQIEKDSWENFLMPHDEQLRFEFIIYMRGAFFKKTDIIKYWKEYGFLNDGQCVKNKKNKKEIFPPEALALRKKIIPELNLIYEAMKRKNGGEGFKDTPGSAKRRLQNVLDYIAENSEKLPFLNRHKASLEEKFFDIDTITKPWKIKALILQKMILLETGKKVDFQKFFLFKEK